MLTRFRWFRGYRKRTNMRHRISVKRWDRKLRSATSLWNSWRFLVTQLSTSVANPTASFGKADSSMIVGYMKDSPKLHIRCVFRRSQGIGLFSCSEATVKSECHPVILQGFISPALRQTNLLEPSFSKTEYPAKMLRICDGYWMTSSQTSGLFELNQLLGHLVRFWPYWATLHGVTLKWLCFHRNHILCINLMLGSEMHFMKCSKSIEIVYGFEWCVLNDGGHIEGWNLKCFVLKL